MQLGAPKSDSQIIPPAAATDEPFPKQPNIPEEGGGEKLVGMKNIMCIFLRFIAIQFQHLEEPPEPRAARIVSTIGGLEVVSCISLAFI